MVIARQDSQRLPGLHSRINDFSLTHCTAVESSLGETKQFPMKKIVPASLLMINNLRSNITNKLVALITSEHPGAMGLVSTL